MKKAWSISTTVRNPDRIRNFLLVLSKFEGRVFDEKTQIEYQIELIRNKFYEPTGLSGKMKGYYSKPSVMTRNEAKKIFKFMLKKSKTLRESPGIRGRTSASPLSKMGLAVAKKSLGKIIITKLGKKFLKDDCDIGEAFLEYFYKWNLPNPYSKDFKEGFNINPFITTLHIINKVNRAWKKLGHKPWGITKEEFSIFIPTTIDYEDIDKTVDEIIKLRKNINGKSKKEQKVIKDKFYREKINNFFGTTNETSFKKNFSTLKDYGDNSIRYFRITRFFYIRGGGYRFDIEPRRMIEIDSLLKSFNGSAKAFTNLEEYISYMNKEIVYPWEEANKLIKIIKQLQVDIIEVNKLVKVKIPPYLLDKRIYKIKVIKKLNNFIIELRRQRTELYEMKNHMELQDTDKFDEFIEQVRKIREFEGSQPVELEYLVTILLHGINYSKKIKPNYPVGDNNKPTFTAPANVPDIECYYTGFDMICEVTMLTGRNQWINEGQPVMRHLRDFEIKVKKECYCLFIAPNIHRDAFNTFNMSNKHGYEGKKQKIIPISITKFIKFAEFISSRKKSKKDVNEKELKMILDKLHRNVLTVNNVDQWGEKLKETIGDLS